MVGELRPMRLQDCVGVTLRREDSLECRHAGARDDADALRLSLSVSTAALVWVVGERPAAFFGVSDDSGPFDDTPASAAVWLLTTDEARRHPVALHRLALRFLAVQPFAALVNWVDAEYASALRWLQQLGFVVAPPEAWGPFRQQFCRVEWRR